MIFKNEFIDLFRRNIEYRIMNQETKSDTFSSAKLCTLLLGTAFMLSIFSCEEKEPLTQIFVIQQGKHYANPRLFQSLQSNALSFKATFDETAMYEFQERSFQDSKNKLLGFSDCNSSHHENSARFAWQWYNGRLEIYAYCYVQGQRKERFIGSVSLNESNDYELALTDTDYVFRLNDLEPVQIERTEKCNTGAYYMLWPYFGGTLPAPHDVSISIEIDN